MVHACWDDRSIKDLLGEGHAVRAFEERESEIRARLAGESDAVVVELALQNDNPIKVLASGPEVRAPEPFFANGKVRMEARHPWWNGYAGEATVVFGHYWRIPIASLQRDDGLFAGHPLNGMLGRAMCVDYSVGGRSAERREGRANGPFSGRLAALRWPERALVFDDGEVQRVVMPGAKPG